MNFIGVGVPEMILIAVLALIIVGPKKLPEVMGQIGRTVREVRRQASEVTRPFTDEFDEIKDDYNEVRTDLTSAQRQLRDESQSLNRELRSTVGETKKVIDDAAIETSARLAEAGESVAGPGQPSKVVKMQRRSTKRKLPVAGKKLDNTNT